MLKNILKMNKGFPNFSVKFGFSQWFREFFSTVVYNHLNFFSFFNAFILLCNLFMLVSFLLIRVLDSIQQQPSSNKCPKQLLTVGR